MYISVIIPTYNSENYIERSLNSVLDQNYENYELLVSDDGSNDNTKKILEKYKIHFKKKNILYQLIFNEHLGPGNARNQAIKRSNHEWIAFLDSDDVWMENKLQIVSDAILSNPDCNCIIHDEIYVNKKNNEIKYEYTNMFNNSELIFNQLYEKNFLSPSSMCIKKKLLEDSKFFDINLPNAQDYDLWLKIGNSFNIVKIKKFLTKYYFRSDNISSRPYSIRLKYLIKIANKYKSSVSFYFYIKKILKLILSKEWIK